MVTWLDANEYGSEGPWILKIQVWSLIYDSIRISFNMSNFINLVLI